MKNQVTSVEQSRRLLELGVPAEKASMFWDNSSGRGHYLKIWDVDDETKIWEHRMDSESYVPAFTVADLLDLLLKDIQDKGEQDHDYSLTLSHRFCWNLCYQDNRTHRCIGEKLDFGLIDLLCDRIEWLLSNGYGLEV